MLNSFTDNIAHVNPSFSTYHKQEFFNTVVKTTYLLLSLQYTILIKQFVIAHQKKVRIKLWDTKNGK